MHSHIVLNYLKLHVDQIANIMYHWDLIIKDNICFYGGPVYYSI
jgi:hypothetical protein